MSVNYIFIARQGPVSPYGAHQVQAKMQITIQIRQQRRISIGRNRALSCNKNVIYTHDVYIAIAYDLAQILVSH